MAREVACSLCISYVLRGESTMLGHIATLVRRLVYCTSPCTPMSALSAESRQTRVLHTAHTHGPLSVQSAAIALHISEAEAKQLLEALFMSGSLAKHMHRGVLQYATRL